MAHRSFNSARRSAYTLNARIRTNEGHTATRRAQAQHNKGEAFTASADDGYLRAVAREALGPQRLAVLVRIFAGLTCPVVTRYQDIIGTSLGTEARRARVASRWLGRPRQYKLLFQNLGERTYNGQIYTARSRPAEVRAIQASFPAQCRYRGGQPPIFRVSC